MVDPERFGDDPSGALVVARKHPDFLDAALVQSRNHGLRFRADRVFNPEKAGESSADRKIENRLSFAG